PAPGFVYEARDSASEADWLDGAEAMVWDSLAARISAPAYTAALAAWLRPRARVIEGARYAGWDGAIRLGSGERITAGAVVLAQGFSLFAALEALMGGSVGAGVKGQVAMLRLPETYAWVRRRPLIYDDGVYVVPKQDPLPGGGVGVALGGTDEKTWRDPSSADPAKAVFIERAHILCPTLRAGDVVSHWAGVRPKCWQRDPIVGRLPVEAPLWVVGGGFKISLGIAHRLGESLVDRLTARDPHAPLPETFEVAHHLAAMRPLKATPDQST
ncbi:MAG: FAD-binding oxidoreductase, partial [Pseudomonadota bacterium]